MSEPVDVIVVGGGMAGLCAARRVADTGLRVSLFEERDQIGGEARPGWIVSGEDRALLAFADAADLRDDAFAASLAMHLGPGGALSVAAGEGALPPGQWGVRARLARLSRVLRPMKEHLRLAAPETAGRFDDRSIDEFGRLYLGTQGASKWIEPWLATRAPVDAACTSRVAGLLALTHRRRAPVAVLRRAPDGVDPRWTRGLTLRCGAPVDAVETRPSPGVRCGGSLYAARAVILAIPPRRAAALGKGFWTRAQIRALCSLERLDSLSCCAAIRGWPPFFVGSQRAAMSVLRVSRSESPWVASLCLDHRAASLQARLRIGAAPSVLEFVTHVEDLIPGLCLEPDSARFEMRSQPSFGVGAYRRLAQARRLTAGADRVFLAGDAWSEATLEGAAQSGRRAAGEVIEALAGRPLNP